MFWNDYKAVRGFHIYDTETDKLKFYKNPFEIFAKVYYNDTQNDYASYDFDQPTDTSLKLLWKKRVTTRSLKIFWTDSTMLGAHDVKIVETLVDTTDADDVEFNVKDTLTLLSEYIDEIDLQVDKTDLKKLMQSLYIESCEVV